MLRIIQDFIKKFVELRNHWNYTLWIFTLFIHQYEIYIIIFAFISTIVVQNGGFCKK